jgi:ABC-type nitrate/sulfonate/bicarbonate transport system substrate-binding protein
LTIELAAAFLPLTDSAVLVAARERGFAEAEGINLSLVRCTSWATVRDRLVYGQVQAAHLLAPLAVAVTLGLSQQPAPLAALFNLGLNGNALTLAGDFAAALDPSPANRISDPIATAHDFAGAIHLHRRKPVIGVVHRFSSHALMLRYWLAFAGVDPDRDIIMRVLPPSLVVEALRAREIDGFIAGEPWSSVAVAEGLGEIAAVGASIWRRGVEKVLGVRRDWMDANAETVDRLLRALDAAARSRRRARPRGLCRSAGGDHRARAHRPDLAPPRRAAGRRPRFPALPPRSRQLPVAQPGIVDLFADGALGLRRFQPGHAARGGKCRSGTRPLPRRWRWAPIAARSPWAPTASSTAASSIRPRSTNI